MPTFIMMSMNSDAGSTKERRYCPLSMKRIAIVFPAWFVFANQSSAQLGVFLGVQALGGMIGGFIFAAFAPKVSQHQWLFGASSAYALALLGLYFLQPG